MSARLTLDQIRAYWTEQAETHGQSPSASWSDHHAIELEIRAISGLLADGDSILDIGCANGYSTVRFAAERKVRARGLDYIPAMVERARQRLAGCADGLAGTADFAVGDITALAEPDAAYDKVVVVRVLINLGEWDRQRAALRECIRVLRPGGMLLLSEATLQGWRMLNRFRADWGLTAIPIPPFNRYLDQDAVVEAARPELELVELRDFASTYYVGTRVIKPLLAQALGGRVDAANPAMEWNRWCAQLPAWGDYGTQKLFVFRKGSGA